MEHFNQLSKNWDSEEKSLRTKAQYAKLKNHLQRNLPFQNSSATELSDGLSVLDFGTGTGILLEQFFNDADYAKKNSHFLGIDTSSGMLDVFNSRFKNSNNVQSLLMNLHEVTLENIQNSPKISEHLNRYHLLISSMAFHHLENPAFIFQKLSHFLIPGGVLAIIDLYQEDGSFHPDPKNMGVFHFGFSSETIKNFCQLSPQTQYLMDTQIDSIEKNSKSYPIFLSLFKKLH